MITPQPPSGAALSSREQELADAKPFDATSFALNRWGYIHTGMPLDKADWANLLATITARDETIAGLEARNLEYSMLAYKWMVAHDRLKLGLKYDFPASADLPESIARAESAESHLKRMEEALKRAASQFRFYSGQHNMKNPPDTAKAAVNLQFAEMCDEALSPSEVTK